MINEDTYLQWLGFLNILLRRVNEQGWLIIDDELSEGSPLLERFPVVSSGPYLEFASDIFSMKIAGQETETVRRYAHCAIYGLEINPPTNFQPALVHCIWNTIDSCLYDISPNIACEFGRIAIPFPIRPKRDEFQEWLQKINRPKPVESIDELYIRADLFIESLNEFSFDELQLGDEPLNLYD